MPDAGASARATGSLGGKSGSRPHVLYLRPPTMAAARRKCADALRAATVAALLALVLQGCCRSAEHHEVRCSEACRATFSCGCGELYFVWTGCNEEHWRRTEVDLACVDIFDALRYGERILCAAASRRPAVASESLLDGPAVDRADAHSLSAASLVPIRLLLMCAAAKARVVCQDAIAHHGTKRRNAANAPCCATGGGAASTPLV